MEQRELETKKNDKGFTLIELLIVIVVLGILATVTVLAVGGITQQAKENSCLAEFATAETAIESYYVQNNTAYPANLGALSPTYMKPISAANTTFITYSNTPAGSYTLTETCPS